MKTIQFLLLLIFGSAVSFAFLKPDSSADELVSAADEAAIKKIIEDETAAYFQRDSIKLISFYADDAITQSVWNSPTGSFGYFKGLKSIRKNIHESFVAHPKAQQQPKVDRSQWFFRSFSENWMWVTFMQKTSGDDGKNYMGYETRVMKKVNGNWKICVMYALSDHGKGDVEMK